MVTVMDFVSLCNTKTSKKINTFAIGHHLAFAWCANRFCCLLTLFIITRMSFSVNRTCDSSFHSERQDETIRKYLKDNSIYYGVYKRNVDCDKLETELRAEFDEIIWTSVEKKGTRIKIFNPLC